MKTLLTESRLQKNILQISIKCCKNCTPNFDGLVCVMDTENLGLQGGKAVQN